MGKGTVFVIVFALIFVLVAQPVSAGIFSDFWDGVKEIFGFSEPQLAPTREPIILGEGETIPIDEDPGNVTNDTGTGGDSGIVVECSSGQTRDCSGNNIGECFAGTETCVNNVWDGVCVNKISPTIEVCDSKDNNCDGQIDEGGVCTVEQNTTPSNETNTTGTEVLPPPTGETAPPADVPQEVNNPFGFGIYESSFASASGENMIQDQIIQSQNALNVKGFDAGSAVGTTFTDSINPYTGALMITQTDAVVSGRRGMDIIVTRQYSSNIFSNINQYNPLSLPPSDCSGAGVNDIACDGSNPYETCETPNTITSPKINVLTGLVESTHTQFMNRCHTDTSKNQDASSYIRAKYLGRGWSMNYMENKIRDPTPIVFRTPTDIEKNTNPAAVRATLTYQFLALRGINSISMSIDGNGQELIHPSMYATDPQIYDSENNLWSTSSQVDDAIHRTIDSHSNSPDAQDTITLYTSSLSPVFIQYDTPENMANSPGSQGFEATHYAKNGRKYTFNHYVPFCERYDDLAAGKIKALKAASKPLTEGNCYDVYYNNPAVNPATVGHNDGINRLFSWADNTYVGSYLTEITDSFGNTIDIQYWAGGTAIKPINNPFVYRATNAGGHVQFNFEKGDPNSPFTGPSDDINDRLKNLEFDGPKGDMIYRQYKYTTQGTTSVPLLEISFLSTDVGGANKIPGTKYEYGYDSITGELTDVFLPTGAQVHYEYAWATSLPVQDIARVFQTPLDINKVSRRV